MDLDFLSEGRLMSSLRAWPLGGVRMLWRRHTKQQLLTKPTLSLLRVSLLLLELKVKPRSICCSALYISMDLIEWIQEYGSWPSVVKIEMNPGRAHRFSFLSRSRTSLQLKLVSSIQHSGVGSKIQMYLWKSSYRDRTWWNPLNRITTLDCCTFFMNSPFKPCTCSLKRISSMWICYWRCFFMLFELRIRRVVVRDLNDGTSSRNGEGIFIWGC